MSRFILVLLVFVQLVTARPVLAGYPWLGLPPTPELPKPGNTGTVPINGVRLWYAEFGHGPPAILVHGGLANSSYWGQQVPALAAHYQVIVLDSRGHGRSTRTDHRSHIT